MWSSLSSVKNVLSGTDEPPDSILNIPNQSTRERRGTTMRKKPVSTVHLTGYLFMRAIGGVHKQYYFVLTEESLTFYRKKNDSHAKGELTMPLKITPLQKYVKPNAFSVIPQTFDKYQWKFIENSHESMILYADNASSEREWRTKIESISQKMMEPYIFPDAIDEHKDADVVSNDFNAIQQTMHNTLLSMLDSNHFNISTDKRKWRSPLSLRGLTSEEQDINSLNQRLRIGEVSNDNNAKDILSASCLAVHNKHNMMVVGARPDNGDNNQSNNGLLSIYNVTVSTDEENMRSRESMDDLHDTLNEFGGYNYNSMLVGDDHDINLVKSWQIHDGIVSCDWRENILLVSTTEGRVYYYQVDTSDHGKTVDLVSHNESNPSEPVIYTHSALQQTSKYTLLSAPGSWMHSLRINQVKISSMKQPDCFLCIENESFHLWSLDSRGNTSRPVYSQKASTSPLFCIEWNPHRNHQFMVAGVSTNLKIIDTRELTSNPSKSVPWKVKGAHSHTICDISWNPLVEYWVATSSSDGCVKVWDIRRNSGPARVLQQHNNVVNTVSWSLSHCELLISGSDDRTLSLWNLRSPLCAPHHLLYSHLYAHPVVACGYSPQRPMQFFGLSSGGELQSVELTDKFVSDFVPHRFETDNNNNENNNNKEHRDVELMIYLRDMRSAHRAIPPLAQSQWVLGAYDCAQDLLNLVSTVGFQSTLAKYHKQYSFDEMLSKIACFYHPSCVVLSVANARDVGRCEQMKLRMFIRKVLDKKEWKKLLIMEDKIFKHLCEMSESESTSSAKDNIIAQIIELLKQYSYCDAIKWCLRANRVYFENKKYGLFLPIAVSLLYPTIYHFADRNIVKSPDPSLLRKSAHILDKKLRDYDFLKWEFNLLLALNESVAREQYEDVSAKIISVWENAKKTCQKEEKTHEQHDRSSIVLNIDDNLRNYVVLSQSAYRLYFNALLTAGYCDRFFIECTRLSHQNKGYEISYIITDIMDKEGYECLRCYLEEQLTDSFADLNNNHSQIQNIDEIRLKKACSGVISIVNICENCPQLPKCLKMNLPKQLNTFQIYLQDIFKLISTKYKENDKIQENMINYGTNLCKRIKEIQENKLNTEYFFRNEIHNLMTMVEAFCL